MIRNHLFPFVLKVAFCIVRLKKFYQTIRLNFGLRNIVDISLFSFCTPLANMPLSAEAIFRGKQYNLWASGDVIKRRPRDLKLGFRFRFWANIQNETQKCWAALLWLTQIK